MLDGLVLTGGPDVDPKHYGEEKKYRSVHVDKDRDLFETNIIKYCLDKKIPILGICRGIQILNVVSGGTLYQDLKSDMAGHLEEPHGSYSDCKGKIEKRRLRHDVKIMLPSSNLRQVFNIPTFEVNSRHHQAVKDVAPGFDLVACSNDAIIEAIEHREYPWVVGVQWHPESIEVYENFKPLFNAFVEVAEEKQAN